MSSLSSLLGWAKASRMGASADRWLSYRLLNVYALSREPPVRLAYSLQGMQGWSLLMPQRFLSELGASGWQSWQWAVWTSYLAPLGWPHSNKFGHACQTVLALVVWRSTHEAFYRAEPMLEFAKEYRFLPKLRSKGTAFYCSCRGRTVFSGSSTATFAASKSHCEEQVWLYCLPIQPLYHQVG